MTRVHIASYNSVTATELTIRSAHHRAGAPVSITVGDSASRDGSREMLDRLRREGLVDRLEIEEGAVRHAAWLDRWIGSCDDEIAVFCDSDVEFLDRRILPLLLDAAESADLVYCESLPGADDFTIPRTGERTRLQPRPAPWLFVARPSAVRALGVSFEEITEQDPDGDGSRTFDVGGRVYYAAREAGLRVTFVPRACTRFYRHFGGVSWGVYGRSQQSMARLLELRLRHVLAETGGRRLEARWLDAASRTLEAGWEVQRLPGRARPRRVAASLQRRARERANALPR